MQPPTWTVYSPEIDSSHTGVGAQQSFSLVYYCHNGFKARDSMKSHIMLICIQVHQIKDKMGGTCLTHGRYDKPIFVFLSRTSTEQTTSETSAQGSARNVE